MNGRGVWRRTAIAIAAVASGAVIAMPAVAAPARQRIDIPAQDLGTALTELARRADREIYFSSDLTQGRHARHLRGDFTVEQALNRLLAGSPLGFRVNPSGSIIIINEGAPGRQTNQRGPPPPSNPATLPQRATE